MWVWVWVWVCDCELGLSASLGDDWCTIVSCYVALLTINVVERFVTPQLVSLLGHMVLFDLLPSQMGPWAVVPYPSWKYVYQNR